MFSKYTKSFTNSTDYWQKRYFFGGNSGKGSYGDEAIFKAEKLNKLISQFNFDGLLNWDVVMAIMRVFINLNIILVLI